MENRKKVLVIDDELSIRVLLNEIIEDLDYEFLEASNAAKGFELLQTKKPSLIILDVQLPQINGLDAIKKIRVIDENVPVFMLTAFSYMKDVVENLGVEVQEFIEKPFDIEELSSKITEVLKWEKV